MGIWGNTLNPCPNFITSPSSFTPNKIYFFSWVCCFLQCELWSQIDLHLNPGSTSSRQSNIHF